MFFVCRKYYRGLSGLKIPYFRMRNKAVIKRSIIFVQDLRFSHFRARVNCRRGPKEQSFLRAMHYILIWLEAKHLYVVFR